MERKYYKAELEPDARGFTTFLQVEVLDGKIISALLDGRNKSENPYGEYKSTSEKYNNDMYAESGTRYIDAVRDLEKQIVQEKDILDKVKGARFISQDANELLQKIKKMITEDN